MPVAKPAASNEADWREARMWVQEMAGMGLHRIESIMDGMNLFLPTKLKTKISARAKSLIETAACIMGVTPGSKMLDGPKKFLCSPIQFHEHKSYDQATQGKTCVWELFT